ncbi:MAG: RNA-binding domain-containing protein, partial [Acetobacterium sp.]
MGLRESRTLEYKKDITNTFLKTVSAFANYRTGEIKFGIDD